MESFRCFCGRKRHSILSGTKFKPHSNKTSSNKGATVDSGCRSINAPNFSALVEDVDTAVPLGIDNRDEIAATVWCSWPINNCDKNNTLKILDFMVRMKSWVNTFADVIEWRRDIFVSFVVNLGIGAQTNTFFIYFVRKFGF